MRNRREFLKNSSGLLAGGAAAGTLSVETRAQNAGGADADAELARLQTARRILLRGGIVLTLDRQIGDFGQADILIEDGKIREVRPEIAVSPDLTAVINASERIVIPGFVDTHSHSFEGILRSSLPNGTIFDPGYRETFEDKLIPAFRPDDVHAGVLVTALGMIDMGTTAVVDTSQINHSPEHSDALVHAFQEAGIRAVCAYSRGKGPLSQYPQDVMRLRRSYFNSEDQLLTLAFATSIDPKTFAFVRENGLRAVLHISNNSQALIALRDAGLMREGDEYIHCAHLNDAAWRAIKETGGPPRMRRQSKCRWAMACRLSRTRSITACARV
jgi:cytosine/adenosine deaminase-related metal-dependent hydrolase